MRNASILVLLLCGLIGVCWTQGAAASASQGAEQSVFAVVAAFEDGMIRHDAAAISSVWHANGRLFVLEDVNTVELLTGIPSFVQIVFDERRLLSLDERIAVVKLVWRMIMPKTVGYHTSYLNLIESDGRWIIISESDYGVEKPK